MGAIAPHAPLLAQQRTDPIVQSGESLPLATGTYNIVDQPYLNDSGKVAFRATLVGAPGGSSQDLGLFVGDGVAVQALALKTEPIPQGTFGSTVIDLPSHSLDRYDRALAAVNQPVSALVRYADGPDDAIAVFSLSEVQPGVGIVTGVNSLRYNREGEAAFLGSVSNSPTGNNGTTVLLARTNGVRAAFRPGQTLPGGGTYGGLVTPGRLLINDVQQVAVMASISGLAGSPTGIFRYGNDQVTQIARSGQAAPGGTKFLGFGGQDAPNFALNSLGQVAFAANLTDNQGPDDFAGIYRGDGNGFVEIARRGDLLPGSVHERLSFSGNLAVLAVNDVGQVAFNSNISGGPLGQESGIFRGNGGALTLLARRGANAPDGNGQFEFLSLQGLGLSGQAYFSASLSNAVGGASADNGYYVSDGVDTLKVAREGDSLLGSKIASLSTPTANEHGQLAYAATLANGKSAVARWTPELRWRQSTGGSWDATGRWTLGLAPAGAHDVRIDPAASLTVIGPSSDRAVRSLRVGGDAGQATLDLTNGSRLTVLQGVTVAQRGTLTGDGTVLGDVDVQAGGVVAADNLTIAGTLDNLGLIRGTGRLDGNVINRPSGQIRASQGDVLELTGGLLDNLGRIESIDGELQVRGRFFNRASTGLIAARNATLRFTDLENEGSLGFSFGTSDVFGDIDNTGVINVSGGANVTFYDDLLQGGKLQIVSLGDVASNVVMFGDLSGNGFVGGGNLFALGDLRPGHSPASVLCDGNLYLGATTRSFFELADVGIGQFDQILSTGDVGLAGSLELSLLDGFVPALGQVFDVIVGAHIQGQFASVTQPLDMPWGLEFDVQYTQTAVRLAVVEAAPSWTADFDEDGDVDGADLTMWSGAYGASVEGDADEDGDTDGADFLTWQRQFGSGPSLEAANATAPEPASLWLVLAALAGSMLAARNQR